MDLRRGDERPRATASYDHTLALKSGERMAGGHKANSMNPRQFPFRVDKVTRFQLPRLEAFDNRALNPLVRGQSVFPDLLHDYSLRSCTILQSALALQHKITPASRRNLMHSDECRFRYHAGVSAAKRELAQSGLFQLHHSIGCSEVANVNWEFVPHWKSSLAILRGLVALIQFY